MGMSKDGLRVWASEILADVRSMPEWIALDEAANNGDEDALIAQSELFESEIEKRIERYNTVDQDELRTIISERIARSCGVI